VLGYDPATDTRSIKDRIGVCLQSTNLPDKITVREALTLFTSVYSRTTDADKLIDRLQLATIMTRNSPADRSSAWPWLWRW